MRCCDVSVGGAGKRREAERARGENGANETGGGDVLVHLSPAQDQVQGQEVVPVLTLLAAARRDHRIRQVAPRVPYRQTAVHDWCTAQTQQYLNEKASSHGVYTDLRQTRCVIYSLIDDI